jgi:Fe-S-cluster containining protein
VNGSGGNVAGCASCKGRCCREYRVTVTVADVRGLAAGTALRPKDFVQLRELEENKQGFRLQPGGRPHELMLVRRTPTGACVFLMELAPDVARCGIYSHRPQVCRNFPTTLAGAAVAVRGDTKCGPNAWNLATMDLTTYRHDLVRARADWAEHQRFIAAWNAAVEATKKEGTAEQLFDFILSYQPVVSGRS